MTTRDIFEETYEALSGNKVRSSLTILGIVIGISSVIAMISIGQGAQGSIESRIQSIGSNLIEVLPGVERGPGYGVSAGRGSARSLTQDDASAIANLPSVKAVAPELSGRYQITTPGYNTNTQVVGTVQVYPEVRNVQVSEGTFFSDAQGQSLSKVAVIGPSVVSDLFASGTDPVGRIIRVKQVEFKIIGVTQSKGGGGFGSQDNLVYVPLLTAERFLAGNSYLTTINVEALDTRSMTEAQADITNLLLGRHHISDPQLADFNILNQEDLIATASGVTQTLTMLLAAVAAISLIVGGIGIMNMMLTTVTERTKEIGLRKAIGATRRDITAQFLVEAVTLTFTGGVVGVILGWLVAFGFSYFGVIQTEVSLSSVVLACGVAAIIGIIFGYYPARRAARLNPIEALRYE